MKEILGRTEVVEIAGKKFLTKIDTGADRNSIDRKVAQRLQLGPIIHKKKVKCAEGGSFRDIIKATIKIKNKKIKATFTLADRRELKYDVLIGRRILKNRFLVDVSKCVSE